MRHILPIYFTFASFVFSQEEPPVLDLVQPVARAISLPAHRSELDRSGQERIVGSLAGEEGVSIITPAGPKLGGKFKLVNNTDEPLYFYGTGMENPHYRLKLPWRTGEVREASIWWCGAGLRLLKLEARHFCEFAVKATESEFRVGINTFVDKEKLNVGKAVVWSEKVPKKGYKDAAPQIRPR